MRSMLEIAAICFVIALATGAAAEQVVIGFDDYTGSLAPIPPGYAGFPSWGNWAYSSVEQGIYGPLSGTTYAVPVALPMPIEFPSPYVFAGAWYRCLIPAVIQYELYLDGNLVHTSPEFTFTPEEYTYYASDYDGVVDAVLVQYIVGGNAFCMDDFTYDDGTVATEASSLSEVKRLFDR